MHITVRETSSVDLNRKCSFGSNKLLVHNFPFYFFFKSSHVCKQKVLTSSPLCRFGTRRVFSFKSTAEDSLFSCRAVCSFDLPADFLFSGVVVLATDFLFTVVAVLPFELPPAADFVFNSEAS